MIKAESVEVLVFFSLQISNLVFDSSLQNFRPEFVHHRCSRAFGHGNFRFAQFLSLNTRFTLHLICLFAWNHCGFDFCQIPSIMIFNFLNSNLCFNFKRLDHDYSVLHMLVSLVDLEFKIFVSDLISFMFIIGWNFLIVHFVLYNFCVLLVFRHQQYNVPYKKMGLGVFGFPLEDVAFCIIGKEVLTAFCKELKIFLQ